MSTEEKTIRVDDIKDSDEELVERVKRAVRVVARSYNLQLMKSSSTRQLLRSIKDPHKCQTVTEPHHQFAPFS